MKIVVATNNFWLGGRETYIDTWLAQLGEPAALLASVTDKHVPWLNRFEEIVECGTEGYGKRWASWLERGGELIRRTTPSLIWAHHYEVLPAWLLSRIHGIPLLTSFHGPLIGANRSNDLMQALGMTLAIHRGGIVTGVSEEILDGIRSLHANVDARLLPNTITLGAMPPPPVRFPPRRFVLLTRRDKLEHIREAALFFARYARRVAGCTLVIADGELNYAGTTVRSIRAAFRQLGARWSFGQGLAFVRTMPRIHFIGWTADARAEIRKSDVVMGMGRVILEAIAECRPAILTGYRDIHGLVTAENFDQFQTTNFSGRGVPARPHADVLNELLALKQTPDLTSKIDAISASAWSPRLRQLLEEVTSAPRTPDAMATEIAAAIDRGATAAELFNIATRSLTAIEIETLYRLAEG